jgi:hypothetical protein
VEVEATVLIENTQVTDSIKRQNGQNGQNGGSRYNLGTIFDLDSGPQNTKNAGTPRRAPAGSFGNRMALVSCHHNIVGESTFNLLMR